MDLNTWVYLVTWTITNLIIVIAAYFNLKTMVHEIKKDIENAKKDRDNIRSSLNIHELQNERTNTKIESDITYVREGIDYIKKYLIEHK